jgi:hypothetical protein
MTTRYYYADPLAAAWMQKKFGMRFVRDFLAPDNSGDTKEIGFDGPVTCIFEGQKYYIHPDSLPLLEPCEGDLVEHYDFSGCYKDPYFFKTETFKNFGIDVTEYFRNNSGKIIQRDGKPFFWPECEAV